MDRFSVLPVVLPRELPGGLERRKPSWIDNYPTDSEYYTGIGSSKTGDEGKDMEVARAKALVNLASSISTEIRSELLITAGESSTGEAYETVDQVIHETVNTNIREVEVVDTYYSPAEGYWFYLRLNKSAWETIRREEADTLARRVLGLLEPVLADDSKSVAARLRALWKGRLLLAESPYAGLIETGLNGRRGVLIDLIESQIISYLESLSVELLPGMTKTHPGKPIPLTISVRSMYPYRPGELTVGLSFAGDAVTRLRVITDSNGEYTGDITVPSAELGSRRIVARIDLGSIGLDPGHMRFPVPEAEAAIEVTAISANLGVTASDGLGAVNVKGAFESLISSLLPVELTGTGEAEYSITVELVTRSAPPNNFGITIAYIKAFVSISQDGKILESYQSPEVKEGGLDLSQAYTRGFNKLVESLADSADFAGVLEMALF